MTSQRNINPSSKGSPWVGLEETIALRCEDVLLPADLSNIAPSPSPPTYNDLLSLGTFFVRTLDGLRLPSVLFSLLIGYAQFSCLKLSQLDTSILVDLP